jgi:integrase
VNHLPAITLRQYYESVLLAEAIEELRPATLKEIRTALRHWESLTSDRPLRLVTGADLRSLRDGMLGRGLAPATVAKTHGHLVPLFRAARADGLISEIPSVGRLRRSILPKCLRHQRSQQRQPVSAAELERLYAGCGYATYPARPDAGLIWRGLLYCWWMYGARTRDLFSLRWSDVDVAAKLIRFRAMKTSKLQGLPLTAFGLQVLGRLRDRGGELVFPGLRKPGCWNTPRDGTPAHWITGYYATWNREVCGTVGIVPGTGPDEWVQSIASRPDSVPPIRIKTLRQTMVTQMNDLSTGGRQLGGWLAGHYQPGVTAQNYDMPDAAIREAVERRERELLPGCFRGLVCGTGQDLSGG